MKFQNPSHPSLFSIHQTLDPSISHGLSLSTSPGRPPSSRSSPATSDPEQVPRKITSASRRIQFSAISIFKFINLVNLSLDSLIPSIVFLLFQILSSGEANPPKDQYWRIHYEDIRLRGSNNLLGRVLPPKSVKIIVWLGKPSLLFISVLLKVRSETLGLGVSQPPAIRCF